MDTVINFMNYFGITVFIGGIVLLIRSIYKALKSETLLDKHYYQMRTLLCILITICGFALIVIGQLNNGSN